MKLCTLRSEMKGQYARLRNADCICAGLGLVRSNADTWYIKQLIDIFCGQFRQVDCKKNRTVLRQAGNCFFKSGIEPAGGLRQKKCVMRRGG